MSKCLELALKGIGHVAPNPLVGSVIVHDEQIIGEGYHHRFGGPHAEVNAINSVINKSLLSSSTLFVNLEPCSHHGKTPPCSDWIVENKIAKVVIGCKDTFSEVSGKGIEKLKAAGIEVVVGVLEKESRSINRRFFTFHEKKRPYIILKWAQSKDGFLEPTRKDKAGSIPVTNTLSNTINHQWRHEEAAILIGKNTAIVDDPQLNVRHIEGNDPIPIVLSNAPLPKELKLLKGEHLHFGKSAEKENHQIDARDLQKILTRCFEEGIQSIIVEGGKQILESFLSEEVYDEIRIFESPIVFGGGLEAPKIYQSLHFNQHDLKNDLLLVYHKG